MIDYNDIVSSISMLDEEQLKQLKTRIDFNLKMKSKSEDTAPIYVEELFLSLLKSSFNVDAPPLTTLKKVNPRNLGSTLTFVCTQIIKLYSDMGLTRQELHGLVYLVIDCAVIELTNCDKAISLMNILIVAKDVRGLLDEAFPSYRQNGFLKQMILQI